MQELENFLTSEECREMIEMIDANHSQSSPQEKDINEVRHSRPTFLDENNELVKKLHDKIANYLQLDKKYAEPLQVQRYEAGQFCTAHHDFYSQDGLDKSFVNTSGNRTKTFVVYLNDDFRGGQTHFINLNKSIKPKTGKAIYWDNIVNGKLQTQYLHQGVAVAEGKKYIITSWWRENEWDYHGDLQKYIESLKIDNHEDTVKVLKYLFQTCFKVFVKLTERIQKLEKQILEEE